MDRKMLVAMEFGVFLAIIITAMFGLWQIDVSVGALSVGGCVTTGTDCVAPLVHYHYYLRAVIAAFVFASLLMLGALLDSLDLENLSAMKRRRELARIKDQVRREERKG